MSKSRWDECCPHCGEKINMYDVFVSRDYQIEFNFACPHCDADVRCVVHTVPEFELSKKD